MPALELFGRYRAVRRLGVGAFATVWLARDEQLDGPVAVKVLADNWASRGDVRERFLEEARMLRRADSDRVVRVHDIGELEDGRPYFVMTYADRGILADLLTDFPMPARRALWYAHETALGVAVLHARGIIHRDVKPSNVLLRTGDGDTEEVLVSDLGLAKAVAVASGITLTAGTPGYMPPEQAEGVGLTFSSDVYALGALTYRLLAGRLPHQVGSPLSVLTTVAEPIPPLEMGAGLPPGLDAVLRRALSRDPAERQADAQAFARALAGAAGGLLGSEPFEQHAFEGDLFGEPGDLGALSDHAVSDRAMSDRAMSDRAPAWTAGVGAGAGARLGGNIRAGHRGDDQATVITRTRPMSGLPLSEPEPSAESELPAPPAGDARRRHRGRAGALVAGIGVAVLLAAGLVTSVAEPGLVTRTRAVLSGNRVVRQAPLAVTVPSSWGQRSASGSASDGPVPAMGSPRDQLTVSDDLAGYRSSATAAGVFLAAVKGDRASAVRSALRYPGCTTESDVPADPHPGWAGTATTRSCGSAMVLTWVGTVGSPGGAASGAQTLLVEVKVAAGQQSLAERVLDSVTVSPLSTTAPSTG